jgi:uncharacterized protein (TIGR02271 family)
MPNATTIQGEVMLNREDIETLLNKGGNVIGTDGDKIGSIGQLYADDDTGEPTWVTVKTGLFGTSQSFVPVEGAHSQGSDLVVPYTKDHVKDAPRVDVDGHLTPEEEDRLYTYYDRGAQTYSDTQGGARTDVDFQGDADLNAGTPTAGISGNGGAGGDRDYAGTGTGAGQDTSGPNTDDAMTRSEERLNVGTERQATGRVRLRKYVTTENVTKTIPVQREEVRLEREPITDANRGAALSGPDISEEEHELVLHEERPVVEKETVPVERVRLDKDVVQEDVTVNEEVRKEHIDADGIEVGCRSGGRQL